MSCTTCPTTSCTCCHVHNVTIDSNLTVGNATTLNTCGNTGGALTVNTSTTCDQTSGNLVAINGTTSQKALYVSAGNVCVEDNITCAQLTETSDARLKTNVAPIDNALAIVEQLNGVRFDWKHHQQAKNATHSPAHIGLVAQKVQSILPEIVNEDNEGTLSVAYTNLVPVLIEAIKELSAQVETLSTQTKQTKQTKQTTQ